MFRPVRSPGIGTRRAPAWTAALLLTAALLIRLPHFGDPAYQTDEQFYLLVGDRLLHGAIPYVDIWDRKPVGLFLIYAAIRLLGGDGILQYQVVAALCAAGTAWIIARMAWRGSGTFGGIAAGLLYLVWIETVQGGGGQAPILYNPMIAAAAWLVLRAGDAEDDARFIRYARAAMALTGLAIQVKYTALFEGAFFGVVLAWWSLRRARSLPAALIRISSLAAIALAPTAAVILFYAAIHQLHAFWFANFQSIGLRASARPDQLHRRLVEDGGHVLILSVCCLASLWQLRGDRSPETRRHVGFVGGWVAAAAVGFGAVGMFYGHYLLPLYVPLCVGAAPIFRRRPIGPVLAAVALWVPFSNLSYPDFAATAYSRRQIAAIQALIPADVDRRCLHILEGPPILYHLTHACLLTPYVFPEHLIGRIEAHAIGTDPAVELARVLRARPRAIITNDDERDVNLPSLAVLHAAQARFYRHAGRVMIEDRPVDVWVTR